MVLLLSILNCYTAREDMKKIIFILLAFLLFSTPAVAAEWDDKAKLEMQDAASHWFHAYELKDVNGILAAVPPGFLRYGAYKLKITPLQMEPRIRDAMKKKFADIESISIDVKAEDIVYRQAPNGELYALIPYNSHVVSTHNVVTDDKFVNLVFKVSGTWYCVDIGNPDAVDNLLTIYPYFKDADISLPDNKP